MLLQIEHDELLGTLKNFSLTTGAKISFFNLSNEEVLSYPYAQSPICHRIRASEEGKERCRRCDRNAQTQAGCQGSNSLVYRCHAGLQEAVCPVLQKDYTLGHLIMGQCRPADTPVELLVENSQLYTFTNTDEITLKNEFSSLPQVTKTQFDAYAGILQACAGYIGFEGYVKPQKMGDFERIKQYIETNLSAPLSAELLGNALYLSRNNLFRLVKHKTGLTLGQYIQKRRLRLAKKLLETTDDTILHIAELCGINDSNYFSRVFKAEYGKSPREHRKVLIQ